MLTADGTYDQSLQYRAAAMYKPQLTALADLDDNIRTGGVTSEEEEERQEETDDERVDRIVSQLYMRLMNNAHEGT
jgi:hypothetical protein